MRVILGENELSTIGNALGIAAEECARSAHEARQTGAPSAAVALDQSASAYSKLAERLQEASEIVVQRQP